MEPTKQSKRLGAIIRQAREAQELSLRQLAAQVEVVDRGYLWKLERGQLLKPAPAILERLATVLGLELADLYALAEYPQPQGLPEFQPYLRAKYDLPEKAIRELERHFTEVSRQYQKGGPS